MKRFLGAVFAILVTAFGALAQSGGGDKPYVILSSGQSNFVLTPAFAWKPNAKAKIWNFSGVDGNIGTSFVPLSSSTINITTKIASDVAYQTGRPVCLINVSFTGQAISHWLPGTPSPDVYQNIINNIGPALAACKATQIDVFEWWQGEADQIGSINPNYIANFTTMMSRFWGNSWFPQQTPVVIHGIAAFSDNPTSANQDLMNDVLQATVNADPDKRRFVYTSALHGSTYWDATNPGHMTGAGYYAAGAMSATALLYGPGRNTLAQVVTDPATGRVIIGNPATSSAKVAINANAVGVTLPSTAAAFESAGSDGGVPFWMMTAFGGPGGYVARASNGTLAAPTTLTTDTLIAFFGAQGYDGTAWSASNAGNFKHVAAENWSNTAHGTYASISGTKPGTTTQQDYVRFDAGCMTYFGSTSGSLKECAPAVAGSNQITWPAGTTNFTGTGGAGQVVKQTTAGGGFTVATVSVSEISGFGTNVGTWLATPSSANLRAAMTDETGTGLLYFQGGDIGTPSAGVGTNITNVNAAQLGGATFASPGTIGGTTPGAATFTTLTASTSTTTPIVKSAAAIQFQTNGTTFAGNVDTSQRWIIGTNTSASAGSPILTLTKNAATLPQIGSETPLLHLGQADSAKTSLAISSFNAGAGAQPSIFYAKARGTAASPGAITSGDALGANFAYGYNSASAAYATAAGVGFIFTATDNYTASGTNGARLDLYATPTGTNAVGIGASVGAALMVGTTTDGSAGQIIMNNASFLMRNKTAWSNGAAAQTATLTNGPAAGNPTKWIPVDDNGTTRYIPAW